MHNDQNTNLKIGQKVWTIASSIESDSYGDNSCRPPYEVIVTEIISSVMARASRFSEEWGIDNDSNASCYLKVGDFALTHEEIQSLYVSSLEEEIDELDRQKAERLDILTKLFIKNQ